MEYWHCIPLRLAAWATGLQVLPGTKERALERTQAWETEGQQGSPRCAQWHARVCEVSLGALDAKKVTWLQTRLQPSSLLRPPSQVSGPSSH